MSFGPYGDLTPPVDQDALREAGERRRIERAVLADARTDLERESLRRSFAAAAENRSRTPRHLFGTTRG